MRRVVYAVVGALLLAWAAGAVALVLALWDWGSPRDKAETLVLGLAPLLVLGGAAYLHYRRTRSAPG